MTKDIERFAAYLKTADILLEQATKEDIANVARVLAFHLGHYRTRFGDIPTTESLHLLTIDKITPEMAVTLVSGLEALIEVLKAWCRPRQSISHPALSPLSTRTRHFR